MCTLSLVCDFVFNLIFDTRFLHSANHNAILFARELTCFEGEVGKGAELTVILLVTQHVYTYVYHLNLDELPFCIQLSLSCM
jgi:hypothetical protein